MLAGIGSCAVEYRGQGHNSYAVIDAINNYYDDTKDEDVKNGYEEGIRVMITLAKNIPSLQDTLDIIFYQCKIKRERKAKLYVDIAGIVNYFNNKIKDDYEDLNDVDGFQEWYVKQKVLPKKNMD